MHTVHMMLVYSLPSFLPISLLSSSLWHLLSPPFLSRSFSSLFSRSSFLLPLTQVQRAEKQRQFEAAMMAEVSEERKEAIWQSAQQKAVRGEAPSN